MKSKGASLPTTTRHFRTGSIAQIGAVIGATSSSTARSDLPAESASRTSGAAMPIHRITGATHMPAWKGLIVAKMQGAFSQHWLNATN